jgi:DNA-binding winged helix-turn-helix (wHTH) protein
VQVSRLCQRLNDDGKQPALIKTVRGSDYVFSTDVAKLDIAPPFSHGPNGRDINSASV